MAIDENTENEISESETDKEEIKPVENRRETNIKEDNVRRSTRTKQLPKYLADYQISEDDSGEELNLMAALLAGHLVSDVPQSYGEAIQNKGWLQAIKEELHSLEENGTWELVNPPVGEKIIDSKWVFNNKVISDKVVKKARLVARGFQQSDICENVYAPVARMVTIRMLLVLYLEHNMFAVQLDVKSAFLYGTLPNPVYMYQPEGLKTNNTNLVCKLKRSLYGLKEAPKCWNMLFDQTLLDMGFSRSRKDPCLYFDVDTYLLIYVDDLILFSKN